MVVGEEETTRYAGEWMLKMYFMIYFHGYSVFGQQPLLEESKLNELLKLMNGKKRQQEE